MKRALSQLPPSAILAVGWAVLCVYAFPGQMTWDSFEYLHATRHGFYTDAHSPALSGLWSVLELVVAGPSGMFVVQSVGFVAGLYLVLRTTFAPRRAAWVTNAVLGFPPVLVPMAVIWEQSLMAALLMFALGALLSTGRRLRTAGFVALAGAIAVHPAALVAGLPIALVAFRGLAVPPLRRHAFAAAVWVGLAAVALASNWLLTDRSVGRTDAERQLFDIAGVLKYTKRTVPDAEATRALAGTSLAFDHDIQAAIRTQYRPRDVTPLLLGGRAIWRIPVYGDVAVPDAQRDAIARAWHDFVLGDVRAYWRHRVQVMKRVLGFVDKDRPPAVVPRDGIDPAISLGVGVPTHASELQQAMTDAFDWLAAATPLFRPWLYLVAGLIALWFARRQADVLALLASGLAAEATLLFTAVDNGYRQSHWMIVCTSLAIVLLVGRRSR